jgi:hypothetical protein
METKKEKSSRGKKVKVNKLKKEKIEELTDKQANRIRGGATKLPSKVEFPN